eukprot:Plantae.Rhodophyta-Purpureofilum_apyrenoidigerum.ctg24580.p1 GENE.Plantae.Rhodophyta-Purpureofilum_apyrenoidigerum.ctg24580~~Plantae.Rhodophyta-Purpureofilum_apyrenoidigerum.ctg24580.p1  ORF type:complete len:237 (-),score=45.92 Plantae.Rhodophyta-Purpureofilum_apyrenoidigerum.ctg24580:121-735(-)
MAFVSGVSIGCRAFAGKAVTMRRARSSNLVMMANKSASIPFLEAPDKLDGSMVGDIGFDPLYLSENINLDYSRAAELKHGRICMLAVLGFVVQELVHLPGPPFQESNPILAIGRVPTAGWIQILAFISAIEMATFKKQYDLETPGDLGFDPLNLAKDSATKKKMAEYEIVHCRAAMVGFAGILMQILVTGRPIVDQMVNFRPIM